MRLQAKDILDQLIVWTKLSNSVHGAQRQIFTLMLLLCAALLGINLALAAPGGLDGVMTTLHVLMMLFLVAMAWLLWRKRDWQELEIFLTLIGVCLFAIAMMISNTPRVPAALVQTSLLYVIAPWFVWFIVLDIVSFFTFRAEPALRTTLLISCLMIVGTAIVLIQTSPASLLALRDVTVLWLAHILTIGLAYQMASTHERSSQTDFLTGLPNRMRGYSMLLYEIQRADRYKTTFSIILFDIDYFKKINDMYGHPVGDAVLREFASFIQERIRRTDLLCRWGGEEFMILLPESDLTSGRLKADHLRMQIKNRAFHKNIRITSSFGVTAFYPNDSPKTILERVDAALYRAKANGRNCIETE
jgi:diguanylate cyclase (GGDEF)-like protein